MKEPFFKQLPARAGSVSWGSRDHKRSLMKAQKTMKALKCKPSAQNVCMMMCLHGHAKNNGYLHGHTLHMPGVYRKFKDGDLKSCQSWLATCMAGIYLLFALSAASVVGKMYCKSARCCHTKHILICSKWLVHTKTFEGKALFQKSTYQKPRKAYANAVCSCSFVLA